MKIFNIVIVSSTSIFIEANNVFSNVNLIGIPNLKKPQGTQELISKQQESSIGISVDEALSPNVGALLENGKLKIR